jgi:serine protease AprX
MILSPSSETPRRKAVWGPKRVIIALGLIALASAPYAAAEGRHGRSAEKRRPGAPSRQVKNYKIDDEVSRRSGDRNKNATTRVIVTLAAGAKLPAEFKKYASRVNGGSNNPNVLSSLLGNSDDNKLDLINGQVLELPNSVLKMLALHPSVFKLQYDRPIQTFNYRTSVTVGARSVQESYGYTGAGIGIAVIDSGLTTWHDDLTNKTAKLFPYGNQRVNKFVDFVNGRTLPYDDNGHGTHIAGIIAGNGYDSKGEKRGIAPDANIISLKVLDKNGQGTISNIIAALGWIKVNAKTYNIRVVNMSVGAAIHESYWTDPLTLAVKAITDQGITVVTAAGNMGKNAAGQQQYGAITAPGNAPWVLTVGASSTNGTLTRNDDTMASFSSAGPTFIDFDSKPDLVAPGVGTISLATPGSTFYATKASLLLSGSIPLGSKPYLSLSGTSMAAPVVSGTIALMLQANPNLTPNLIKAILQYTAQQYPGYNTLRQGAGFLNTLGAVRLAKYYLRPQSGERMPVQKVWSRQILWGNHRLTGGVIKPTANAWASNIVWGMAKTLMSGGDNIVWGTMAGDGDNVVWGTAADGDNVVWGTSFDGDNVVWGTMSDGDNIVWGTDCGGADCDNVIWGTASDGDNIVWGTAADGDNVVWGTSMDANIIWATSADEDATWGSSGEDQMLFPEEDTSQPLPDIGLEFGDTVPLVPTAAPATTVTVAPIVKSTLSIGPVSIGGI